MNVICYSALSLPLQSALHTGTDYEKQAHTFEAGSRGSSMFPCRSPKVLDEAITPPLFAFSHSVSARSHVNTSALAHTREHILSASEAVGRRVSGCKVCVCMCARTHTLDVAHHLDEISVTLIEWTSVRDRDAASHGSQPSLKQRRCFFSLLALFPSCLGGVDNYSINNVWGFCLRYLIFFSSLERCFALSLSWLMNNK